MIVTELSDKANLPFLLLLTADPDLQKIKTYCRSSKIFIAQAGDETIGVYVLERKGKSAEIWNIAVAEKHQNKGIGKKLLQHAIGFCKKEKITTLEVGTGNSSISQIAFYQKCGFRIVGVVKDYFLENYKEVIVENGIPCRDMVRFELKIK